MKKVLVLAVALMATILSARAEVELAYEAGFDAVSTYIWRGQYNGGMAFQPDLEIGYDGEYTAFRFGAWGNIGASDWMFRSGRATYINAAGDEINPNTYFVPEVDLFANFQFFGTTIGLTHYYFFGGTPFFSKLEDGGSQTEFQVGYDFEHFFEQKFYINWYTMFAGSDARYDENDIAHRAWSSYLELGYDYTWENIGLTLGAQLGMSPWESPVYGNSKFAITNLAVKVNKEWEFEHVTLELYGQLSVNPDWTNKDLVWISKGAGDEILYKQRLNEVIGLGVWF